MKKKYDGGDMLNVFVFTLLGTGVFLCIVFSVCMADLRGDIEVLGGLVCPEGTALDKLDEGMIFCENIPEPELQWNYIYDGIKIPIKVVE